MRREKFLQKSNEEQSISANEVRRLMDESQCFSNVKSSTYFALAGV